MDHSSRIPERPACQRTVACATLLDSSLLTGALFREQLDRDGQLGPPVLPFYLFLREGSPTKIDSTLVLTSLLEDLDNSRSLRRCYGPRTSRRSRGGASVTA